MADYIFWKKIYYSPFHCASKKIISIANKDLSFLVALCLLISLQC